MTAILGVNAKAYRLSTGTRATWGAAGTDLMAEGAAPMNLSEVTNCKDISIPMDDGDADVTTRAGKGFKLTIGGLTDVSIDLTMIYDPTDTHYTALVKAKLGRGSVAMAFLSGDKATLGVQGLWADFAVTKMEKGEPMGEAQTTMFTLKPTLSAVPPEWIKVVAGS